MYSCWDMKKRVEQKTGSMDGCPGVILHYQTSFSICRTVSLKITGSCIGYRKGKFLHQFMK